MKRNILFPLIALLSLWFAACDDQIMEWSEDPTHGDVTIADLPLELQEQISRYEALKSYTDFTLGIGVGMDQYMDDSVTAKLVNQNYDEITIGYAMKHGPMVKSDGSIDFTKADAFIARSKAAGLTTYGHTLVWHSNQNASYLNGLLAPQVIPGSAGSNALDISGLQDGSFTGWNRSNGADGMSIQDGKGLSSTAKALVMTAGSAAANAWDMQIQTPEILVDTAHSYEISFYVKSDKPGKARLSYSGMVNTYPWADWYGTGGSWTEAFETTTEWQQVKIVTSDFNGTDPFKMNFDFGYLPDVTYYLDVENIKVVDTDAAAGGPTNLIANGDFEGGTLDGWGGWGNSSTREVSAQGAGFGDTGYAMVLMNPTAASNWQAQQKYDLAAPLEVGKEYTFSFMAKADVPAALQVQLQGGTAQYFGGLSVGVAWTPIEVKMTPGTDGQNAVFFDFGETAATLYIDNVVLSNGEAAPASGPTIIEKTAEEKKQLIANAMEAFVTGMVSHYKDDIKAWDVVNEPMRENGEVRNGIVDSTDAPNDEFQWVYYLGKDYAVEAFKLARAAGNADDILFINDYNLEYSLSKCDGLISYVEYIESKGATVDGIGTQMHISYNSDTAKIKEMFTKLAASGKLIKISELDVRLGTASPTAAQLAVQSDMYKFVIDQYKAIIPAEQQYGITIWSLSDNPDEHEYWLPDESPNLFDANYNRKHAYKGVADGLAGKDISDDFTGELVY